MRAFIVSVFQALAVIGIAASLGFGCCVLWGTAMVQPVPYAIVVAMLRSMVMASVGVFGVMMDARFRLAE